MTCLEIVWITLSLDDKFSNVYSESHCSKPDEANPGLMKNFNCYLFTAKGGFFTRLSFKEKEFVIYNLSGPQFCSKSSFSRK